jgi:hypothetical protein
LSSHPHQLFSLINSSPSSTLLPHQLFSLINSSPSSTLLPHQLSLIKIVPHIYILLNQISSSLLP